MTQTITISGEIDLRTDLEKRRDARRQAVCREYSAMLAEFPTVSINRLLTNIADRHGLTLQGVRYILQQEGLPIKRNSKTN